ncbi:MAG TPA: class I SAM-dependent methyltransferase, partial [Chitinophagaceae bacterium]|nr:class I SAM-dependent methyltransferase [Chitinophagaceae bacterium]
MYTFFQLVKKYINYYTTASNSAGHGMHSPFVFDFIKNVLNNKAHYKPPRSVENLRTELLKNGQTIQVEDFGAGSRNKSAAHRKVRTLAKNAVKPKKYGQLLYRIVKHYKPKTIVELGTSLGITTAYLAMANLSAKVTTIEGSAEIQKIAANNFNTLRLNNIESLTGNFDVQLPHVLAKIATVDLAYIDGNHRLQPTLNYFDVFLAKSNNN